MEPLVACRALTVGTSSGSRLAVTTDAKATGQIHAMHARSGCSDDESMQILGVLRISSTASKK